MVLLATLETPCRPTLAPVPMSPEGAEVPVCDREKRSPRGIPSAQLATQGSDDREYFNDAMRSFCHVMIPPLIAKFRSHDVYRANQSGTASHFLSGIRGSAKYP